MGHMGPMSQESHPVNSQLNGTYCVPRPICVITKQRISSIHLFTLKIMFKDVSKKIPEWLETTALWRRRTVCYSFLSDTDTYADIYFFVCQNSSLLKLALLELTTVFIGYSEKYLHSESPYCSLYLNEWIFWSVPLLNTRSMSTAWVIRKISKKQIHSKTTPVSTNTSLRRRSMPSIPVVSSGHWVDGFAVFRFQDRWTRVSS